MYDVARDAPMTLDTAIHIAGPVDIEDLRAFCGWQIGGVESWICELSDVQVGYTLLTPGERVTGGAHLSILYVPDEENGRDVEVCWTTGWGSRSPMGESPVTFHRRLADELGAWLSNRGLTFCTYQE
jgi:hypothetical protein